MFSRKKKFLANTIAGVLKQIITVLCGFILPRYMLVYYGSEVNGLISSITHFLCLISFLDMGVGAVIQANLYKPLAERNIYKISQIVKASEVFFRKLGCIFIVYIIVLCFIFPYIVNFDSFYTVSLVIILSVSTIAQYLFGMTYQLLLSADQKSYIVLILQTITILLNTYIAVVLMRLGAPVHVVKILSVIIFFIRPVFQMIYVHRCYKLDRKKTIVEEPIKQKWNGFSQHFAAIVCQNIDVAVLTFFSTMKNVSVYSVYYMVTNGVQLIIMTAATGLESLFGNMIAKNENERLLKLFNIIEWVVHNCVTIIFSVTAITIVPFISIYTNSISDADYFVPVFAIVLVSAYAIQCLRMPYFRVIKAAGHFKQTQNGAYISALLNIFITMLLVFKFGLIGAATGTFIAMLYHTCYFVWYLRNNIIYRNILIFIKYLLTDAVIAVTVFFLAKNIYMDSLTYLSWIIFAIKVSSLVFLVSFLINLLLYRKYLIQILSYVKGI